VGRENVQGVPEQFIDEKDSARFRHLAQVPGVKRLALAR